MFLASCFPCLQVGLVQVRVFELGQLSLKFERHLDAEIVDFQVGKHS